MTENVLNKSVISPALLKSVEPIECEMAFWVSEPPPPAENFEAEGFGRGRQVVSLERQELSTEPLKSPHVENVAAFETTRGPPLKIMTKSFNFRS